MSTAVDRQIDAKDGAGRVVGSAAETYRAAMLFDDALRNPKTQTGALRLFGGDKGSEKPAAQMLLNTGTGVGDHDRDAVIAVTATMPATNPDVPAGRRRGIDRINEEVGDDLSDFALKASYRKLGFKVQCAMKPLSGEFAPEEFHDGLEQIVQIDAHGLRRIPIKTERLLSDL